MYLPSSIQPKRRHLKHCGAGQGITGGDCPRGQRIKCPFVLDYRDERGRRKQLSLDTTNEAEAWAKIEALRNDSATLPPRASKHQEPTGKSVTDAVEAFLRELETRGQKTEDYVRFLKGRPGRAEFKRAGITKPSPTMYEWCQYHGLIQLSEWTPAVCMEYRQAWTIRRIAHEVQWARFKAFFNFCVSMDWLPKSPCAGLKPVKVEKVPVCAFTKEDEARIFEAVRNNEYLSVMCLVFRRSGLAPVDLVQLKPSSLKGDRIVIERQKTRRPVRVLLPPEVANRLRALPLQQGGYWFWDRTEACKPHRCGTQKLQRLFAPVIRKLKIYQHTDRGEVFIDKGKPQFAHLYQWRHTFAVRHIAKGTPIKDIADMMGDRMEQVLASYSNWIKDRDESLDAAAQSGWGD